MEVIPSLRLILLDDHELIREGMRALIARVPGWSVAAEAEEGIEGIRLTLALQPDVVVTDLLMGGANGLEVATRVRAAGYRGGIVLLSAHHGEDIVRDAQAAGVNVVIPKSASFGVFSQAVLTAARERPLPPVPAPPASSTLRAALLTPREREVVQLFVRGASSKEAASALGISAKTIDVHRHRAQAKLGANGPAELVRIAVRAGLADL